MPQWLDPSPVRVPASFQALGLHPLAAQILVRRGITDVATARAFLDPDSYTPAPAEELPDLRAAVERIIHAVRRGEKICVWGDFDVDGQTATALLVQTLRALGAEVTYHIPIRAEEGHGLHIPQLSRLIQDGVHLILTCDTGITAHEAVRHARSLGAEVIITDHHLPGETLPPALAVVNPKRLPASHPLATLPGVGVAYKLAEALLAENQTANLLDLVALGIVADVAELHGDTRYLLQRGLERLRATQRLGLRALYELAGLRAERISEEHIGFVLAPRLNALGRLGDANPAVELLTTDDPSRARLLATQLEGLNARRKLLTSQVYRAAEAQLRADPDLLAQEVIILGHPAWPGGVIGIVAGRLAARYHKPVILLTTPEGEPARGSARSVEGIHITEAIAAQKDLLLSFGGHPMAAGLSLPPENLPEFRRRINRTVRRMIEEAHLPEPTLHVDAYLPLSALTLDLAAALDRLSPFGPSNPPPVLATRDLRLRAITPLGRNGDHVKLTVEDADGNAQAVLWWNGADEEPPPSESRFDLAYTLRTSDYRGQVQIAVELVDFRLAEAPPVEVRPERGIVIHDLRAGPVPLAEVEGLLFAEGEHKREVGGSDRTQLSPAETLILYTPPPDPQTLRLILERVRPRTLYLVAQPLPSPTPQAFLTHLAGLVKYAIGKMNGQTTLSALAAASAQSEITVRFGLEWLAAGGHIGVEVEGDDVRLRADSPSPPNRYLQSELFTALKGLLQESAAYRTYLRRVDADALMQSA